MIERHVVKGGYHDVRVDFYGPNTVMIFDNLDDCNEVTLDKEQAMEVIKLLSNHFSKEN